MDGFINAKIEKQTIYEIYRACRLCGAGAGYKMPIIQNVVDLDGAEVELKQKIRECVQIEVHQDDKMPPLICELCVDKVNDFYEFLEMCRQTNKRTRLRLGLPPQAMPRGAPDAGDCILGVTEPVFINDGSNEHSLRSKNKSNKSGKNKKEVKKVIISHNSSKKDSRDSRNEPRSLRSKQPSPPRLRGTKRFHEEDVSLNKLEKAKKPASILKKEVKIEDNSFLAPRLKRPREREMPVKKEMPNNKKVKIVVKPLPARTTRTSPHIKSKSPPPSHRCKICKAAFDNYRSLNNHMRSHLRAKQVDRKPVKKESKDVKCTDCGKSFPKRTLLNIHTCPKQGGNCKICNRHFYSQKSLIRHRSTCVEKKKDVYINPKIRRVLRPLQIRVARCDPILKNVLGKYYDVSGVEHDFGLDKNCHYPYASLGSLRIKFEPGYMVDINDDIRQAFDADKYVHWDSDDTDSDLELTNSSKKVDSLTSLSLKTIFSQKFLGKVPKKRRKVKAEKAFDSILNVSEFDTELKRGIDNIIESLDDDKIDSDKGKADKSGDNDSLFGDENAPAITNNDFDSLFDNNKSLSTVNDKEINDNVNNDNDKNITENSINESTVSKELSSKDLSETELSRELDETLCMTTDNESIEKENVSSGLDENVENTEVKTNITNVNENIDSNENTNVNDKDEVNTVNTEVMDSLDQNVENKSEEIKQVTESSKNDSILSETTQINNESSITNNTLDDRGNVSKDNAINTTENTSNDNTQAENGAKTDKSAIKTVNGESELEQKFNMDDLEDLSESEMDDKKLMAALDAQIGENETGDAKNACESDKKLKENMDAMVPSVKSADLESISDEEFNLNE